MLGPCQASKGGSAAKLRLSLGAVRLILPVSCALGAMGCSDVHSGAGLLWCPPWGKGPHLEERGGRGEEDFPYMWWAVMLDFSGEENVGSQIILGGKNPHHTFILANFLNSYFL